MYHPCESELLYRHGTRIPTPPRLAVGRGSPPFRRAIRRNVSHRANLQIQRLRHLLAKNRRSEDSASPDGPDHKPHTGHSSPEKYRYRTAW